MRLTIRKKLFLFTVLPTFVIFVVVGGFLLHQLQDRLVEQARGAAARQAQHYADQIDGRFAVAAQIALSTAASLESQPQVTEQELYATLRLNVTRYPLIFGAAIAFQPGAFDPERRLFCPYVCEDRQGGLRQLDIGNSYDYDQPEHEWWWDTREAGRPIWTAPYIDQGAGEILMVTFAVPFYRDGEFRGVATIDLPLATLQRDVALDRLPRNGFAIVDDDGEFVAHPDSTRIQTDSLYLMAERFDTPGLADVARRMAAGESGVVAMPDWQDRDAALWLYYAPIRSTGWTFASMVEEEQALAFVRRQAVLAASGLAFILLLIVISVLLMNRRLTAPIERLRRGVQVIAGGDLDAEPIAIATGDEIEDLGRAFNGMVADLRSHIERLAEEKAARKIIEGELEAARKIQSALLPQTFPPYPDRDDLDLHAEMIPAKSVAGDFFDFHLLDDDTLVFVVADVSGKGVPAALFMAVTRTLLRNLATVTRDPGEIFGRCSRMLLKDNTGSMFVTGFLGVYDIPTGILYYANAGHPRPYRLAADGKVSAFGQPTGTMLGLFEDAEYGAQEDRLEPGDRLVLFTDGVTEAEAPDESMLEEDGFVRVLQDVGTVSSADVCDQVIQRVLEWEQGVQADDITVLVLGRPPVSVDP